MRFAVSRRRASSSVDPGRAGDEPLARRHQLVDAVAVLAGEQVARREEAEQPLLGVDDEEAR